MKTQAMRRRTPSDSLTATIGARLAPAVRAEMQQAKQDIRKARFQAMYRASCNLSLSQLLDTREQVLVDWTEVGESESRLQLAVIECRIDKVRAITQRHGCNDPVPGHVRLDQRATS